MVSKKKSADPLPYIIVFAILFLIGLGVLTWTLGVWYKSQQCAIYPNIWCSDNWTCNNNCPTGYTGNSCFLNATAPTGLASCIYGPDAPGAKVCLTTPAGTSATATSCDCPTGMQQTANCFSGCSQNFSSINFGAGNSCCCKPGTSGCPWTTETLPAQCKGTT